MRDSGTSEAKKLSRRTYLCLHDYGCVCERERKRERKRERGESVLRYGGSSEAKKL